jgi:imidazolonepropionase-like amidohydrolase
MMAMTDQAGIPPADVVRMATVSAAGAIGLGDRKGRIAPGYDADLLAVAGDPLTDLSALGEVRAVYRSGRRVV